MHLPVLSSFCSRKSFWCQLIQVVPDRVQRAVKWLCCVCVSKNPISVHLYKCCENWFFALDLTHYTHWVPVFINTLEDYRCGTHRSIRNLRRDISQAKRKRPTLLFLMIICMSRTTTINGDGGAVDILGSETALLKWMVARPDIA